MIFGMVYWTATLLRVLLVLACAVIGLVVIWTVVVG